MIKKLKLEQEEKEMLEAYERGELKTAKGFKKESKLIRRAAVQTVRKNHRKEEFHGILSKEVRDMNEIIFSVHIEKLPEGYYLATSNDLPGLVAQGRTINETLEIARDVARKLIESYKQHGDKLPGKIKNKIFKALDMPLAVGVA